MAANLGEADYRQGAMERMEDARVLLERQALAGSVYLAGRAVEGILRAAIWRHDKEIRSGRKSLETGHDLRELLSLVRSLGVIHDFELNAELSATLQRIGRPWSNNMRFWPSAKLFRHWREIGEIGKRRSPKHAVKEYYQNCSGFIRRIESLCQT
jgi:HEPN domain-containing protein